jgi:hypothetical protein
MAIQINIQLWSMNSDKENNDKRQTHQKKIAYKMLLHTRYKVRPKILGSGKN